jgi:hypothetical protein
MTLVSIQTLQLTSAGVIWRGDSVIDGVPETLDMLRAMVGALLSLSAVAWRHSYSQLRRLLHSGV